MSEPNSWLLSKMNAFLVDIQNNELLSKLPPGSWQANFLLTDNILSVNILRSNDLLIKHNWYELTDGTRWFFIVAHGITTKVLIHASGPEFIKIEKMKIVISAKSEEDEWLAECEPLDLIVLAGTIGQPINSISAVMATLNPELIKYN